MALKAWYYDSFYRYTMTDNLQPIATTARPGMRRRARVYWITTSTCGCCTAAVIAAR